MAASKFEKEVIAQLAQLGISSKIVNEDVSEIKEHVSGLLKTAANQESVLSEHIRRTDLNEQAVQMLTDKHHSSIEAIDARFAPLEKHISMWAGAWKLIAALGILAGIGTLFLKIIQSY